MALFLKIGVLVALVSGLAACGSDSFRDLDEFMADKKARPGGVIQPIPPFKAYSSFAYSAAGLRSPFEQPVEVVEVAGVIPGSSVRPDPNRAREFLEQFPMDSLNMVGSVTIAGQQWALVRDSEGGVHRVRPGNFMGRNHGRIVELSDSYIAVVEIVPSGGVDGWVERPRKVQLRTID